MLPISSGAASDEPNDAPVPEIKLQAPSLPSEPLSAPVAGPDPRWIAAIQVENDLFGGTDANYTSGVRFAVLSPQDAAPEWVLAAARALPFFDRDGRKRVSFALGQSMFTPENLDLSPPDPRDRPYAGWLYGSIGLVSVTDERMDNLLFTVGVVGPGSRAKQTQKTVHNLIGSPDPRGWDQQLRNEPGIILEYERKWRNIIRPFGIAGFEADASPHVGFALGNVFTHAAAGMTFRLGTDLRADFAPPRVRPSLPGSTFFEPRRKVGGYFFLGAEARAVGRNIFLDGNTFRDGPSVDREVLVGELQAGIAITTPGVRYSYTHVVRTREFSETNDFTTFGALSVAFRF
ncbi:MAG: lipid A deacylase LpxR family protein [Oceanicaulis sp.]|nr:lipid A deacylase LpxR family protein [Oceanicaulis sp.]